MRNVLGGLLVIILLVCALVGPGIKYWGSLAQSPHTVAAQTSPAPRPVLRFAAPGTGTCAKMDMLDIFYKDPPLPVNGCSLSDLPGIFPAFKHRPFDHAGFNAVMLPFAYTDADHVGDANEAMALTALISNDLDWSPGCYCARHAYFVYKQDPDRARQFMQGYNPSAIVPYISFWEATHAIGGKLILTPDGYEGEITIFDRQGAIVYEKHYDQPRSFWDLLGGMDVDAMSFLDVKPSAPLVQYLHIPRCTNHESIIALGSAALMDYRSPEEFDTYQGILAIDPGFSMVRHWYANQKHWADRDHNTWATQNAIALSYRIEPASLEEFDPSLCDNPKLSAQLPGWIDQAQALTSPDSPLVLESRLRNELYGSETLAQVLDRATRVAAQYPNSHSLLVQLAAKTQDIYLACSVLSASLLDYYLPGIGNKDDEKYRLAWSCDMIGRDDVSMNLLNQLNLQTYYPALCLQLKVLARSGRYDEAADLYPQIQSHLQFKMLDRNGGHDDAADLSPQILTDTKPDESSLELMAPWAVFSAFMADRTPLQVQALSEQKKPLAAQNMADLFQVYTDAVNGKRWAPLNTHCDGEHAVFEFMLNVVQDSIFGFSQDHCWALELMRVMPMNRLLWMVEDRYEQYDPSADAPAFYTYLQMFFSYDPWVRAAIADYHKRGSKKNEPVDLQSLKSDLREVEPPVIDFSQTYWQHIITPWKVSACVNDLLEQHAYADAAEITQLYARHEDQTRNTCRITIAQELIRRVAAASATTNPSPP
jgi:hypothetical protein